MFGVKAFRSDFSQIPILDGLMLVAQEPGSKICLRQGRIVIYNRAKILLCSVPVNIIETVVVVGKVQITTEALYKLAGKGISVAYVSSAGHLVSVNEPWRVHSCKVRRAQIKCFDQIDNRLMLSRALVWAKTENQHKLLLRNLSKDKVSFDFRIRILQQHPPIDPVNAVLSLDYTLLGHEC